MRRRTCLARHGEMRAGRGDARVTAPLDDCGRCLVSLCLGPQVKKLIMLSPEDQRDIKTLALWTPVVVSPTKSLLELLNTFQMGHSHLALVR